MVRPPYKLFQIETYFLGCQITSPCNSNQNSYIIHILLSIHINTNLKYWVLIQIAQIIHKLKVLQTHPNQATTYYRKSHDCFARSHTPVKLQSFSGLAMVGERTLPKENSSLDTKLAVWALLDLRQNPYPQPRSTQWPCSSVWSRGDTPNPSCL